jgi:hypothetical protein
MQEMIEAGMEGFNLRLSRATENAPLSGKGEAVTQHVQLRERSLPGELLPIELDVVRCE